MTKDQFIESVRQAILKQQATQDSLKAVHPKVIEAKIAEAYNTAMKTYYESNLRLMDAELDFYAKKYTLDVSAESYTQVNMAGETETKYTGRRYVTLTARPVQLKKNLGIRRVFPYYGDYSFVRSSESEVETIKDMEVYCCMNKVFYYMDGDRLVFDSGVREFDIIDKVHVKMLPIFDDLEEDDNVEFPQGEMPPQEMILQLMGFRPTDNTNDDVR